MQESDILIVWRKLRKLNGQKGNDFTNFKYV